MLRKYDTCLENNFVAVPSFNFNISIEEKVTIQREKHTFH